VEISSATGFTLVLSATDKAALNQIMNKNGTASTSATTYDVDGAAGFIAAQAAIADTGVNGVTVSNVSAPTITSAAYNASTGALTVTGTGLTKFTGATNDIDVSKLTFTGEGGSTYTLTSATDVEITNGTSFTVTLSAADKAALNLIMNSDGTSSTSATTYNIAGAEDWTRGADSAVTVADLTGNAVTVSSVPTPTITSATYNVSTGALVVTGTNFTRSSGSDIDLTKLTFTGAGTTYTLTSAAGAEITDGTSFSVTLNATDKAALNLITNSAGTASTNGTAYNLAAGEDWAKGAAASVVVADLTGNGLTVNVVPTPAITSATYNASTGTLVVTGTGFTTFAGATNDIDLTKLTFTGEGTTYTLTSATGPEVTSSTSFSVTLNAADKAALNQIMNKDGGFSTNNAAYNLAAAEDWARGAATAVTIADLTSNGITVSGVPVPTITSATYDYNSNVLTVTGTGLLKRDGATNDIDISKFTFTGEGGATYTLTSASDVEITSGTAFSITLSGADLVGVESLLNKDGATASSGTTYNLNAAEDWAVGADAAVNVVDATGNGITVSNYAVPTVTSATYDYSTGALVVTGTNFVSQSGATNDIDISKLVFTGEGGVQYQLTSASDVEITSATSYTVTLSGADLTNVEGLLNKTGTTSATSATTFSLVSAEDWMTGSPTANNVADAAATITVSNYAAPTITSAAYDYNTNVLTVTGTNFVTQQGATNDVDLSTLTFTGEGGTTYTLTTATDIDITSATTFSVTLSGADLVNVETLLNKSGTTSATAATTYNLGAADNWMFQSPAATDIADATGNGVTVSNYAVPTITSTTYDFATGTLVVTGANLVAASGANNDIVANKFTFTGDGGATYTLTDTSNVDVTSATAFTITLSATDKVAVGGLLNKDGTSSDAGTTYNINAAEDWAAGAPAANNVVDATGNGVTVSNYTAPAITSATYDYNTNVLVVTGTNFMNESGATNDVDISLLTFRGEGGATYTLTSASDVEVTSATSFSVTLAGSDLVNVEALLNNNGATSATAGTTYNLNAADNWMPGAAATANIADATNAITVSNYAAPTVTSATYNVATGTMVVTGTNFVNTSGATNDITANLLTLTGEGGNYTLTDTANVEVTSATSFTLTLSATDQLNINGLLNKNGTASSGATTYNLAAADNWMAGTPAALSIADATGNGVTVSNVATPTITSATYDSDTGTVSVTGTNLFKKVGATNDIDISTLTFTGGTGNATYTVTSASDIEITSATAFSFTLSGSDKTNVDALLDQIGTSSSGGSTYNIAGADNWLTGADAATNIADATNAVTVSISPKITSATYNASTGSLVVTGTNIQANGGGLDIDASMLTLTGEGGATYTLTDTADVNRTNATSFTLTLSATDKAALNQIMNKAGTSSTGTTTYNVAAADNWNTNVTAGDTADATGNGVTVSNVAVPTITSSTYDANTGTLVVTGTGFTKFSGATNDIDVSKFTFTGAGGTYTLTNATDVEITSGTAFTLTLSAADKAGLNQIMNKNGTASNDTVAYNLNAAEDWAVGADAAVNVVDATGNGVTVSNVAMPTITSSTYDASTGSLVVTGTGFLSKSGATNDIVANKFTFTGEGGATYTLTNSSNVEVTSGTAFTVTLSATDKAALNLIMNKDGTAATSTTTYNLNAAEDWAAGADTAVNVVDATGNGVTVSNVAVPAITSSTYDAATGTLVVTGTGFTKANGANNDIDVSMFTFTGAGSTYTLTDSSDVEITSGTAFTVTLSATDKAALNQIMNKNGTSSTNTVAYNLNAAENWTRGADAAVNVVDATGNAITVSNVATPTITSTTYDAATGSLVVTGTGFLQASGATNDIDVSMFTFTGEGGSTYTLTDSSDVEITSGTAFTLTLSAADKAGLNQIMNSNGTTSTSATTYNLNAAEDWAVGAAAAANVVDATGNGVTVSNVAVPAITSSTYDATAGTLVVTGTGFSTFAGAANDIDASMFTFTGKAGATYTLTDSSDVEITSGTTFTLTLSAADKTGVNKLLDKNGATSTDSTTYNLAAAEDWAKGAATAVNVVDATGNGVTVSNTPVPKPTTGTGLNTGQQPPSGGTPTPPPPPSVDGEGGGPGDNTTPPIVTPIPGPPNPGRPIGPSDNVIGNEGTYINDASISDPGGVDVLSIVGNSVGGHSNLIDSFYGAGRTDTTTRSGDAGTAGPAGGAGGFSALAGNSVLNGIGGLSGVGGPGQGFGETNGNGFFSEGQGNGQGEQNGQGAPGQPDLPGPGAALRPTGRAGFSDQLAQAADGFATDMSLLAAAVEQAKGAPSV